MTIIKKYSTILIKYWTHQLNILKLCFFFSLLQLKLCLGVQLTVALVDGDLVRGPIGCARVVCQIAILNRSPTNILMSKTVRIYMHSAFNYDYAWFEVSA